MSDFDIVDRDTTGGNPSPGAATLMVIPLIVYCDNAEAGVERAAELAPALADVIDAYPHAEWIRDRIEAAHAIATNLVGALGDLSAVERTALLAAVPGEVRELRRLLAPPLN